MSKITAYAALSSTQSDDVVVIVDVHDTSMASSGTTKKITVGNLALVPSNNLSDVSSPSAAVGNLGLTSAATAAAYALRIFAV